LASKLAVGRQQLLRLFAAVPENLEEMPAAEEQIREAVLQLDCRLLQAWSEAPKACCCAAEPLSKPANTMPFGKTSPPRPQKTTPQSNIRTPAVLRP